MPSSSSAASALSSARVDPSSTTVPAGSSLLLLVPLSILGPSLTKAKNVAYACSCSHNSRNSL
jgi:hypothetical protein